MSICEFGLYEVIDYVLAKNDCYIEDVLLRDTLKELIKKYIYEIGIKTTDGALHAGRRRGTFFDLERTFDDMKVKLESLVDTWSQDQRRGEAIVNIDSPTTADGDYHREPPALIVLPTQRESVHTANMHEHLPPFPSIHTYQKTWIEHHLDRTYEEIRNRAAENQLNIQKALNKYYLRSRPSFSLFISPQRTNCYDVLAVEPSDLRKPPYLSALISPRESCNQHPLEEDDEEDVVDSPFLAKPLAESIHPRTQISDEEFIKDRTPSPVFVEQPAERTESSSEDEQIILSEGDEYWTNSE